MKNRYLFKVGFACALLCASVVYTSCGDDDDPTPSNQNTSGTQNPTGGDENPSGGNNNQQTGGNENENPNKPVEEKLVSELKCTVDEFATKYTTLKKGEKVTVTLTDVSDANIAKVSETLKAMQTASLQKAGEAKYIVTLILESVQNALKTIPADTFKGVEVLREVVIPACVEVIQSDAFAECVNLVSAKILGADTKVDEKAFENANEEIKVEQTQKEVVEPEVKLLSPADIVPYVNASNEEIVTLNMPLDTYDHADVILAINKITNKKVKLVIPEGVKELAVDKNKLPMDEFGFKIDPEPKALVNVEIPEGVTVIGERAFSGCSSLNDITIPESVTKIGVFAFNDCNSLRNITIPGKVSEISEGTFYFCTGLTSLVVPESVAVLAYNAFENSGITSLTVPNSVNGWSEYTFEHGHLTSIKIPEGVSEIGESAFIGCGLLSNITIPNSVTRIGAQAFIGSSLASIIIPDGVTEIGDRAFDGCDKLETIYCSQAIYEKYHEKYPKMVVKSVSGNVNVDDLEFGKDIK